ncbi:hypothetical protein ACPD0S_003661 [Vibrio cholerae]
MAANVTAFGVGRVFV